MSHDEKPGIVRQVNGVSNKASHQNQDHDSVFCYTTQVSLPQEEASLDTTENPTEAHFEANDVASKYGNARRDILAAQFECYLKIIHEPLRTDEGEEQKRSSFRHFTHLIIFFVEREMCERHLTEKSASPV